MKNRNFWSSAVDSVFAVIQTVLFALTPTIFDGFPLCQIVAYGVLLAIELIYIFLLRKIIIDKIVAPKGIDTSLLLRSNCADNLRRRVLPLVCELQSASKGTVFDEYMAFMKWEEASTFVTQHFWQDGLTNVVLEESVRYSSRKVYRKELLQIVESLIENYNCNKAFGRAVNLFDCKTFERDVNEIYKKLVKMKKSLKG